MAILPTWAKSVGPAQPLSDREGVGSRHPCARVCLAHVEESPCDVDLPLGETLAAPSQEDGHGVVGADHEGANLENPADESSKHCKRGAQLREDESIRYVLPVAASKKGKDELSDYAAKFASRGGKARATALSAEQRREIARRAAVARWSKRKKK